MTILAWYEKFRDLCSTFLISKPLIFDADVFIGDKAHEVEIDESFFGKKAKNDRGTSKQNCLVFGIIEKKGKKCVLYMVPTNSREILIPLIEKHIPKTTKIFHDGLSTYSKLHELGYEHSVVFHNKEFVTEDGVHTNTIEGAWGLVKQKIASMHGIKSHDRLAAHLDEFSFRQNFKDVKGSIFDIFIEKLAGVNEF
uniref:ISXO2-like transposase domain-containing protein n=1 Tax=Romanomermis culicivorax TaxID=13658 RepID=A0A915KE75_ROMCU